MSKNNGRDPSRGLAIAAALGKSVAYVLLFVGSQFLVSLLGGVVIAVVMMRTLGYWDETAFYDMLMGVSNELTLLAGLFTLIVVIAFYELRRRPFNREIWLRAVGWRVYPGAAALAMVLYWMVTLIFSLLPTQWLESYAEAAAPLDETGLLMALGTVVVAPVVEEVIFRGLVLSRLNRVLPGWPALLLSAAIFGVLHGHPVWMLYAGLLGVAFGLVAMNTGSILPSMVMHVVFNGIGQLYTVFGASERAYMVFQVVFGVVSALAAIGLRRAFPALMNARGLSRCPYGCPIPEEDDEGDDEEVDREDGQESDSASAQPPRDSDGAGEAAWDGDSGERHRFTVNDL